MAEPLTWDELRALGMSAGKVGASWADAGTARTFHQQLLQAWTEPDPVRRWSRISTSLLSTSIPESLHWEIFLRNYAEGKSGSLAPAWVPTPQDVATSNIGRLLAHTGHADLHDLETWAQHEPAKFWGQLVELLGIRFRKPGDRVLDLQAGPETPHWFPGATLNLVDSCLRHESVMVTAADERGRVESLTRDQLQHAVVRFAGALHARGLRAGDAIALVMPLGLESLVAYLGAVSAGVCVVGIAESFANPEIERRCVLGAARAVFVQHQLVRQGKVLPLYERLATAALPPMVVSRCDDRVSLRSGDLRWDDFLAGAVPREAIDRKPDDLTTLLFSSGTTGDPKAIPWTQMTPIQCVADGFLYQDIRPGDTLAWPTGMGWMMGPWLVYAGLVNGANLLLFDGHAATREFVEAVARHRVTVLGVIPSLVAAWRRTGIWDHAEWRHVRLFSTTGECSHPRDMLALMARAGYRPVIEYCGGTELAGGYLASTVTRPNVPAVFNQACLGIRLRIEGQGSTASVPSAAHSPGLRRGEAFLSGPNIGFSTRLLNADHHQVYYEGTPAAEAASESSRAEPRAWRRHGDLLQELGEGYYRVLGRADDAMNLGGIKVSAVELERVCNEHRLVLESAAVAVNDEEGGPARLVVFVVPRSQTPAADELRDELQALLRERLSPQFRIDQVQVVASLPRTASHKVMRRTLRAKNE